MLEALVIIKFSVKSVLTAGLALEQWEGPSRLDERQGRGGGGAGRENRLPIYWRQARQSGVILEGTDIINILFNSPVNFFSMNQIVRYLGV